MKPIPEGKESSPFTNIQPRKNKLIKDAISRYVHTLHARYGRGRVYSYVNVCESVAIPSACRLPEFQKVLLMCLRTCTHALIQFQASILDTNGLTKPWGFSELIGSL